MKIITDNKHYNEASVFTPENLTVKRPASGISPLHYWEYLGKSADRNYHTDELI